MKKRHLLLTLVLIAGIAKAQTAAEMERNEAASPIYITHDPSEKEKLYKAWIKKYPPANFSSSIKFYDYIKAELSKSFAMTGNAKKAMEYIDKMGNSPWNMEDWSVLANIFLAKKNWAEAGLLLKKLVNISHGYPSHGKDSLVAYAHGLAKLLVIQEKYNEALPYAKEAYDSARFVDPQINFTYARVLKISNKKAQAFHIIEEAVLSGIHNNEMFDLLKELFLETEKKVKWVEYHSQLKKKLHQKKLTEISEQLINIPAPDFSLPGIDGKQVSLSSLRGKIVILDFWATWCGPCIASFPFMQELVNKFAANENVGIYFIHTWERDADATKKAADFMKEKNYSFKVLMDLKDPVSQVNKASRDYQVPYIPHKLIIDKSGAIRFIHRPMNGTGEAHMEDLEAVIELLSR